jgi:hypothetical protein
MPRFDAIRQLLATCRNFARLLGRVATAADVLRELGVA